MMNAMKKSTFLPAVAALPALCAAGNPAAADSAAVAAQDRPDIILFMVDDMGWQDTSVPFWKEKTPYNRAYHTPNMERLAASGMKFTQAYACPVSSPTRCSLITGANAARHRVTNWTMARDQSTDIQCDSLTMPEWNVNGVQQTPGRLLTTSATPVTTPSIAAKPTSEPWTPPARIPTTGDSR